MRLTLLALSIAASLLATSLPVPPAAIAADDRPAVRRPAAPIVETTGDGTVMVEPDQAVLSLAVTTEGATAQAAMDENARRMNAVLQALTAAGFSGPAVSSQGIRLMPVYEQRPNQPQRIASYRATNQVQVKTPKPATIGKALDAGVAAGANVATSLAFSLRDPQAAQTRALRLAVEDAHRRATAIAEALGGKLGRVLEVKSLDGGIAEPMMGLELARGMAAAPPTPVEPGQITVRARAFLRAELQ